MAKVAASEASFKAHAEAWAEEFELIDRQLSPLGLQAMEALDIALGETVVDVGCGTGQTLLQLAQRVGPEGKVYGVDISGRLLDVATKRVSHLETVRLFQIDATMLELPVKVDAIFSRFGVMAFDDPVAAFRNFHKLLRPAGRVGFCCWRSLEENELDRLPLEAAGLGSAHDTTPFTFSKEEHVRDVLTSARFTNIEMRPFDQAVTSGDLNDMVRVLLKVGPLGKLVRETPSIRSEVEPRLRKVLSRESSGVPSLVASVWIVTASC